MDDTGISRLLTATAQTLDRSLVVMELKGTLLASERPAAMKPFRKFEASAEVLMATPNAKYKALIQELPRSDGARVSEPQPLPDERKGKPLFPIVTYRNVTMQVNYGPAPLAQLPIICQMLQDV